MARDAAPHAAPSVGHSSHAHIGRPPPSRAASCDTSSTPPAAAHGHRRDHRPRSRPGPRRRCAGRGRAHHGGDGSGQRHLGRHRGEGRRRVRHPRRRPHRTPRGLQRDRGLRPGRHQRPGRRLRPRPAGRDHHPGQPHRRRGADHRVEHPLRGQRRPPLHRLLVERDERAVGRRRADLRPRPTGRHHPPRQHRGRRPLLDQARRRQRHPHRGPLRHLARRALRRLRQRGQQLRRRWQQRVRRLPPRPPDVDHHPGQRQGRRDRDHRVRLRRSPDLRRRQPGRLQHPGQGPHHRWQRCPRRLPPEGLGRHDHRREPQAQRHLPGRRLADPGHLRGRQPGRLHLAGHRPQPGRARWERNDGRRLRDADQRQRQDPGVGLLDRGAGQRGLLRPDALAGRPLRGLRVHLLQPLPPRQPGQHRHLPARPRSWG